MIKNYKTKKIFKKKASNYEGKSLYSEVGVFLIKKLVDI